MTPATHDRDSLVTRLRGLLEPRPEILEAYLFGSNARRQAQPHSDIDIAVFIDDASADQGGFGYRSALTADLMAGLGCNDVDVVILNEAPPLLYHRVLSDGVRVFSRDLMTTTTREGLALSRYCDFVPQLDKVDAAARPPAPAKVAEP
ncbi:MAG: nucleotidyltransferase domain-containing protein [Candidatus Sulfomarinibacteraceae bacterium]